MSRPKIAAVQLNGRGGPPEMDEGREVLIRRAQSVGHPTAQTRMFDEAIAMAGGHFDDGREMIGFMAIHGANDSDLIDHSADAGKPIGDGNPGLSELRKSPAARNDRPSHGSEVVAKTNGVHQRPSPFVVFGIERIDMADAAAHEEIDDRLSSSGEVRQLSVLDFSLRRPECAHRRAHETGPRLKEEFAPRNPSAREQNRVGSRVTGHK